MKQTQSNYIDLRLQITRPASRIHLVKSPHTVFGLNNIRGRYLFFIFFCFTYSVCFFKHIYEHCVQPLLFLVLVQFVTTEAAGTTLLTYL